VVETEIQSWVRSRTACLGGGSVLGPKECPTLSKKEVQGFPCGTVIYKKTISPRVVVVRWLAHAPLIREARVRFSPEAGHLGKVFSGFPSPSR